MALELGTKGTQREAATAEPVHGVMVDESLCWRT